jgi:hypothetical protein
VSSIATPVIDGLAKNGARQRLLLLLSHTLTHTHSLSHAVTSQGRFLAITT